MRRRLATILLLLLVGAAMNVGVAWACVLVFVNPDVAGDAPDPRGAVLGYYDADALGPIEWCGGDRYENLGWTRVDCMCGLEGSGWAIVDTLAAGWPAHSMLGRERGIRFLNHGYDHALMLPERMKRYSDIGTVVDYLPLLPMWRGFAINTLFYALATWCLVRSLRLLLHVTRTMRGRCPKCGYCLRPDRERGSSKGGCSECGWRRRSSAEHPQRKPHYDPQCDPLLR